uniref:Deoxynucleotidyltransferase terminal-interacting protein 1 n=1 Tax=Otus sunia TaxID=257818 RepID=A0A8C8AEQ6_9STRI
AGSARDQFHPRWGPGRGAAAAGGGRAAAYACVPQSPWNIMIKHRQVQRRGRRSQMTTSFTDPAVSMDLLRAVLQPSINEEIRGVFNKYMKVRAAGAAPPPPTSGVSAQGTLCSGKPFPRSWLLPQYERVQVHGPLLGCPGGARSRAHQHFCS